MEAFLEQSVVLLLLAFTGGIGTTGLVVGLTTRRRRRQWQSALVGQRAAAARVVTGPTAPFEVVPLPEPLLAAAPRFELAAPPRTRREARSRR